MTNTHKRPSTPTHAKEAKRNPQKLEDKSAKQKNQTSAPLQHTHEYAQPQPRTHTPPRHTHSLHTHILHTRLPSSPSPRLRSSQHLLSFARNAGDRSVRTVSSSRRLLLRVCPHQRGSSQPAKSIDNRDSDRGRSIGAHVESTTPAAPNEDEPPTNNQPRAGARRPTPTNAHPHPHAPKTQTRTLKKARRQNPEMIETNPHTFSTHNTRPSSPSSRLCSAPHVPPARPATDRAAVASTSVDNTTDIRTAGGRSERTSRYALCWERAEQAAGSCD
ncbi:hypothetical protein BJ912DRAFT_1068034 [Pholiota molesta]|nr:hypothetical protein BJ912DRAFT_1068034 [Pholiota molesta]